MSGSPKSDVLTVSRRSTSLAVPTLATRWRQPRPGIARGRRPAPPRCSCAPRSTATRPCVRVQSPPARPPAWFASLSARTRAALRLAGIAAAGAVLIALVSAFLLLYLHVPRGHSPLIGWAPKIGAVFLQAFPYPGVRLGPAA